MTDLAQREPQRIPIAPAGTGAIAAAPSTNTDWAAILAGAAIASALSIVMAAFGSAIGLSLASPYGGTSPATHYVALTLWVLWVTVTSFAAGGYVCGRLRRRVGDATQDEVETRDGAHGLVVWAISMLLFAAVTGASLYQVAKAGVATGIAAGLTAGNQDTNQGLGGSTASGVTGAGGGFMAFNPVEQRVDQLLRGEGGASPQSNAAAGNVGGGGTTSVDQGTRQIVSRIFIGALATGSVSDEDRAWLANVVASREGTSPTDANRRVDTVIENLRQDHQKAKAAADEARKIGIVLSFIAAAAMLIGASAAWAGASLGGRHRDENIGFGFVTRW